MELFVSVVQMYDFFLTIPQIMTHNVRETPGAQSGPGGDAPPTLVGGVGELIKKLLLIYIIYEF